MNVLCAYLRMPYQLPDPDEDAAADRERVEERDVRLAAQRLLTDHLCPDAAAAFWSDIALDLTGAQLIDFDLYRCVMRRAMFADVTFHGGAYFGSATFSGRADFWTARFLGEARFDNAEFLANAHFGRSTFNGRATFDGATFQGTADFQSAAFTGDAVFRRSAFAGPAGSTDDLSTGDGRYTVFQGTTFGDEAPAEVAPFVRVGDAP